MFSSNDGGVPASNTPIEKYQGAPSASSSNRPSPDRAAILATLEVLFESDHVIELRAFPKKRKQISSGYFDSAHWPELADHAVQLSSSGATVCVTINPVDPQLLGRYSNRVEFYATATTTDRQTVRRRWLLIDLDPSRPANTSATGTQLEAAHVKAKVIYKYLKDLGWGAPLVAISGNGYHLQYAIDLPNDDETTALLKAVLTALANQFDDEHIKVDQTVYNASRVCKLYGTVANKGDNTETAPWRLSKLVDTPNRTIVTVDQLRMLLPTAAPPAQTTARKTIDGSFNVEDFLTRNGLDYTADFHDGRERFKLAICPFNTSHVNGEAAVFRDNNGVLGFKCLHDSCSGNNWKALREHLEGPQPPERKELRENYPEYVGMFSSEAAASSPPIIWPVPTEIETDLPAAPEFDAKTLLPPSLAEFVMDAADRMRCAPDFIATALVVCLGAAIGAKCAIKPKRRDDWIVTPNLYGAIVGPPSSMKSPALGTVTRFLDAMEASEAKKLEDSKKRFAAEVAAYEAHQSAIKAAMKNAASKTGCHLQMTAAVADLQDLEEPEKPQLRRYKTNDSTVEMLGELLSNNPQGLIVVRDELIGLLASWEREGREGDKAFYLEGWNGTASFNIDRIGRGSLHINNLCLSVFGGIQPDLLERYLAGITNSLDNDGRFQRFQVMVYPNAVNWEWRDRYPVEGAREAVRDLFAHLANFEPIQNGAAPNDDFVKLPYFCFDDEAQDIFVEWCTELYNVQIANESNPMMQQHFGKFPKLFCAIALILHLAEGNNGSVTVVSALRAAAWCEYLAGHARRIYGMVEAAKVTSARMVSRRLSEGKLEDGFTVRDLVRKQWSGVTTTMQAENALGILEDNGHVQSLDSVNLGRPTVRYYINPQIKKVTK